MNIHDFVETRLPYAKELELGLEADVTNGTVIVYSLASPELRIPIGRVQLIEDGDGEIARLRRVLVPPTRYVVEVTITRGHLPVLQLTDPLAVQDLKKLGLRFDKTHDGYISTEHS